MPLLDLRDGLLYATLDILHDHLAVPVGTLRRWASEDNWPTRKIHGRRYYLMSTAERSYHARGRAPRRLGA